MQIEFLGFLFQNFIAKTKILFLEIQCMQEKNKKLMKEIFLKLTIHQAENYRNIKRHLEKQQFLL